jgi:hypothetical protein
MAENVVEVRSTQRWKHFQVPNFAIMDMPPGLRQDGLMELPKLPIAQLDAAVLDALVGAWLRDVYSKAGRSAPELRHD